MNRRQVLFNLMTSLAFGGLHRGLFAEDNSRAKDSNEILVTTVFESKITNKHYQNIDDFWLEHNSDKTTSWIFRLLNSQLRGTLLHHSVSDTSGTPVYVRRYSSMDAYLRHMKFVSLWVGGEVTKVSESSFRIVSENTIATDTVALSQPKILLKTLPS